MTQHLKPGRLKKEDTLLLIVDIQQRFVPHIHAIDGLLNNAAKITRGCILLGVPIIVTEQYPQGLGPTVAHVKGAIGHLFSPYEKDAFSVFDDRAITRAIEESGRKNILIGGIEAHICVIKSALDGIAAGYNMHWLTDVVSSRAEENAATATRRALQCGAFSCSTEMALFQLMETKNDREFQEISKLIR